MANGASITLSEAQTWTQNYQDDNPNATKAWLYDTSVLDDIITQSGCLGVRIYNAINDDDEACLVLVGVDANGDDMTEGVILDKGSPCPHNCDTSSPLYHSSSS